MARPISETKIHRPNKPNLVIEHISGLEEHGATAVLLALGFMKTGVDGVWYDRAHLTIIDNPAMSRKLNSEYVNSPRKSTPGVLLAVGRNIDIVQDVLLKND